MDEDSLSVGEAKTLRKSARGRFTNLGKALTACMAAGADDDTIDGYMKSMAEVYDECKRMHEKTRENCLFLYKR